ncbi:MAG: integrase core domain-containing protein [Candidatus Saccharibacteria bacterium]|nr:integrase core domain-containing protein [Candidatus Saccharibacteria bacterium]
MRREYLKRHIRHSISRPGTPTDNPLIESFFSRLKEELLNARFSEAKQNYTRSSPITLIFITTNASMKT